MTAANDNPQELFIAPGTAADGSRYRVRKHDNPTQFLAEDGERVASHKYWLRRIADGSVVLQRPLKIVKPTPSKNEKEIDK
jgi:hypothetical protein